MSDAQIKALQRRIEELENTMRRIPARPRSRGGAAPPGAAILEGLSGLTPGRIYYPATSPLGSWALWDGVWWGGVYPALAISATELLIEGTADLALAASWGSGATLNAAGVRIGHGADASIPQGLTNAVVQQPVSHGIVLKYSLDSGVYNYRIAWHPALTPGLTAAEITAGRTLKWLTVEGCEDGDPVTFRVLGAVFP